MQLNLSLKNLRMKVKTLSETKEEKIWVKMPNKSGVWKAEKKGDEITGKYLKKLPAPFMNRPNSKYCLESDHPLNVGGKVTIYGTQGLNNAMEDVPIGYKVRIVYQGDSKKSDPNKKPFQNYDVYVLMSKEDELYQKILDETGDPSQAPQKSNASTMKLNDAPSIRQQIDGYIEIMESQFLTVTCEALIKFISSDPDLDAIVFSRIKAEIVAMNKAGEINREKDLEGK